MKIIYAICATAIIVTFSGCWVRLPSKGPSAIHAMVGRTAIVTKNIYIYRDWDGSRIGALKTEYSTFDSETPTVNSGERVKVTSIVSRRLPPGLVYYSVLKPLDSHKPSFDYLIGFGSAPNPILDDTFHWTN